MRAACCEAQVLRHTAIQPDIRLLEVLWPDPGPRPPCGAVLHPAQLGRRGRAVPVPAHQRPQVGERDADRLLPLQLVGEGTRKLAALQPGDRLQLTGPMGNGFDLPALAAQYRRIALVGGGIGTAPMYQTARELAALGIRPDVFFGFRDQPYCMEPYRALAGVVKVSTDSGGWGSTALSPSCMTRRTTTWC